MADRCRIAVALVTAAASALVFRCSPPTVAGGGTEDVNARVVTGTVLNADGTPAGRAQVQLIPAGHDPVRDTGTALLVDTTNSVGGYCFTLRDSGFFSVQIVQVTTRMRAAVVGEEVAGDTSVFAPAVLLQPGTVKIEVPREAIAGSGYIYIPGTTLFAYVNSRSGFITLDSVPVAASAADIAYREFISAASTVLRYDVTVRSDETVFVRNPGWPRSHDLVLNTSATGAGVSGDVAGFPVLLRLNSFPVVFSEARPDGGDLRFFRADTISLPFEIVRWEPENRNGEVWVKVDTIRGNDSTQKISMYWGNPNAAATSDGRAVFDTSAGFAGVWHLSETAGIQAVNASSNGFSGTFKGGLPRPDAGPVGYGQRLARPDTDYVDAGNVLNVNENDISLGIWVKRGSFITPQALITKSNGDLPSVSYGYLLSIDPGNFPHFNMAAGGAEWGSDSSFDIAADLAIADTAMWHYLYVVIDRSDNAKCRMFVDGEDRTGKVHGDVTSVRSVTNALHLCIGTENDRNQSFNGSLSEATIAFTARSADWVRLSYMNQKAPDALVMWKAN